MRMLATFVALALIWGLVPDRAGAQPTAIDLQTTEGVALVKGQWRYKDAKVVEVDNTTRDKREARTYAIEPLAGSADFDDGDWEIIEPETLKNSRGNELVCFGWYRIKITLPPEARGKMAAFTTTVDDYGEVWVDGKLPRKGGQNGGSVVAGFNAPNRVELADPAPGKVYQIAVFAINGPISAMPKNALFLRNTRLELSEPK